MLRALTSRSALLTVLVLLPCLCLALRTSELHASTGFASITIHSTLVFELGGGKTLTLHTNGDITTQGGITAQGDVSVSGNITTNGGVTVLGNIFGYGDLTLLGNIIGNGNSTLEGFNLSQYGTRKNDSIFDELKVSCPDGEFMIGITEDLAPLCASKLCPLGNVTSERCYSLVSEAASWKDAEARCQAIGGHLVSVDSDEEAALVSTMLGGSTMPTPAWIGLTKSGSDRLRADTYGEWLEQWRYSSGAPLIVNHTLAHSEPVPDAALPFAPTFVQYSFEDTEPTLVGLTAADAPGLGSLNLQGGATQGQALVRVRDAPQGHQALQQFGVVAPKATVDDEGVLIEGGGMLPDSFVDAVTFSVWFRAVFDPDYDEDSPANGGMRLLSRAIGGAEADHAFMLSMERNSNGGYWHPRFRLRTVNEATTTLLARDLRVNQDVVPLDPSLGPIAATHRFYTDIIGSGTWTSSIGPTGVRVALRASVDLDDTCSPLQVYPQVSPGVYQFPAKGDREGAGNCAGKGGRASWNLQGYIDVSATGLMLEDFTYEYGFDVDPSEGTRWVRGDFVTASDAVVYRHNFISAAGTNDGDVGSDETMYRSRLGTYAALASRVNYGRLNQRFTGVWTSIEAPHARYDQYLIVSYAGEEVARVQVAVLESTASPELAFGTTDASLVRAAAIRAWSWHHVVATYDGSVMRCYLDGVQSETTGAKTGAVYNEAADTGETYRLYVGSNPSVERTAQSFQQDGFNAFSGYIDNVRIIEGALTPAQVFALHQLDGSSVIEPYPAPTRFAFDATDGMQPHPNPAPGSPGHYPEPRKGYAVTKGPGVTGSAYECLPNPGSENALPCLASYGGVNLGVDTELTVAAWLRPVTLTRDMRIVSKCTNGREDDHAIMLSYEGASEPRLLRFRVRIDGGATETVLADPQNNDVSCRLSEGTWRHVAVTWSGITGKVSFYVDGALCYEETDAALEGTLVNTDEPFAIGAMPASLMVGTQFWNFPGARPFHGRIDDVVLDSFAYTAEDVARLARSRAAPQPRVQDVTLGDCGAWWNTRWFEEACETKLPYICEA